MRKQRYASFDQGNGKLFEEGKLGLEQLRQSAIDLGEPAVISGKQERLESMINYYI